MSFCSHCGKAVLLPLPVEPVYSLDMVAMLLPATKRSLEQWLSRNKSDPNLSPPQWRPWKQAYWRMLTASDVRYLRSVFLVNQEQRAARRADYERRRDAGEAPSFRRRRQASQTSQEPATGA